MPIDEFKDVLIRSSLAERRPVNDVFRMTDMARHANLIITTRDNGKLVGISSSLLNFSFCTHLYDQAWIQLISNKVLAKS